MSFPLNIHILAAIAATSMTTVQAGNPSARPIKTADGQAASAHGRRNDPDVQLAFYLQGHWYDFHTRNHDLVPILAPPGLKLLAVALTRDGKIAVASAELPGSTGDTVLRIDPAGRRAPVRLTRSPGYFNDPSISPDQKSIYLTHVPGKNNVPMAHSPGEYAEIYQMPISGGPLSQITTSRGCHFSPMATKHRLIYVHAACISPSRTVDVQTHRESDAKRFVADSSTRDPRLSPDGKALVYAHTHLGQTYIVERRVQSGATVANVASPESTDHPLPQFGDDGQTIYFAGRTHLFAYVHRRVTTVAEIPSGEP